jgi:hypothetical protein
MAYCFFAVFIHDTSLGRYAGYGSVLSVLPNNAALLSRRHGAGVQMPLAIAVWAQRPAGGQSAQGRCVQLESMQGRGCTCTYICVIEVARMHRSTRLLLLLLCRMASRQRHQCFRALPMKLLCWPALCEWVTVCLLSSRDG